jgi:tetratricopeptide (TPR) repeat protein
MRVSQTSPPRWVAALLAAVVVWSLGLAGVAAEEAGQNAAQTQRRIDRLIEQLGDADYFLREQAEAELAKLSFEAFDALQAATTHEDLEIASRARHLLQLMRVQWTVAGDPPEVKGLLAHYEALPQPAKLGQMRSLAALPKGAGVPALCRLVRYETSPVLSKYAAVELIGSRPFDVPPSQELAEVLRKNLGPSRQTAAGWLMTWARFGDDPRAAIAEWTKLTDEEYATLRQSLAETDITIVARLVRFQVQWLKKLDQKEQTLAAMQRLVDLETGNAATLGELVAWLIEQQAWESIDKLTDRFPAQIAGNPLLLYTVAQAQAAKGRPAQAEQMAQRALALNQGNNRQQLESHFEVARALWQRGMSAWAEREFRHILDTGTAVDEVMLVTSSMLGEMLHDQGAELKAAEVLDRLDKAVRQQPILPPVMRAHVPGIRSRMEYFYACHFADHGDRQQQREHLDKAIAADPSDVDVLIARYRLPDQTPEYRAETRKLIAQAGDKFRREMTHAPDDATAYNQFAWLVANTEGDLEAALEFSQKSIELSPGSGGYYDTLAHVYSAKGDYQKAVETQTRAAQLEPHTKAIARQLEVFRKKWHETKKDQQP